jgi:hypothetical protein
MAEHSRALHFKTGNTTDDVTLYTTLGEVVDPTLVNQDNTTGGITLYTTGADTGYPAIRVRDGNDTVYGALCAPSDMRATNLRVRHNNTTYAAASASSLDAYGVCYFQENGAWVWRRVDENGNPLTSNPNFNAIAPWSGIQTVVIDGQTMVKIPKFYVKAGTIASGTYSGAKARWVCASKKDGFHIHPAFVKNGYVMDCIYMGAYEASLDANNKASSVVGVQPSVVGASANYAPPVLTGFRCEGVYDIAAVNYLLLIELGTPDAQTAIGRGNVESGTIKLTGSTNAVYRGIYEWWGNTPERIYDMTIAMSGSSGSITRAFIPFPTNQGDGGKVTYNFALGSGHLGDLDDSHISTLDLNDLFVASSYSTIEQSLIPDSLYLNNENWNSSARNYSLLRGAGNATGGDSAGPFCINYYQSENTYDRQYYGYYMRIAKDGTLTSEAAPNR